VTKATKAVRPYKEPDPQTILTPLLVGAIVLSTLVIPAVTPFLSPATVANAGWIIATLSFGSVACFLQKGRTPKIVGIIALTGVACAAAGSVVLIRGPSKQLETRCLVLERQMEPGNDGIKNGRVEAAAAVFSAFKCAPRLNK
jgi:hypothetical protein